MQADPLVMRLYRAKRDAIRKRQAAGEITKEQEGLLLRTLTDDLFNRRGNRIPLNKKD